MISDALKRAIWATAREVEADVLRWTAPHHTGIPVGARCFDDHLLREVTYAFCGEISRTFDIDSAAQHALSVAQRETRAHNAVRPRDMHWQRDPGEAGHGRVLVLRVRFGRAIAQAKCVDSKDNLESAQ